MPRILVLEDSQYLRLLYALRLAAHGHVVVAAPDSSDGLKQVQASDPDLIMKNPHPNPLDAGRPRASSVQHRACVHLAGSQELKRKTVRISPGETEGRKGGGAAEAQACPGPCELRFIRLG